MKLKTILGGSLLAAVLALGVGGGLAIRNESKAALAAEADWYYAGTDTAKSDPAWSQSATHYIDTNGDCSPSAWSFIEDEEFKFRKGDEWYGINNVYGPANTFFEKYDNGNIHYKGKAGAEFTLKLTGGDLYAYYPDGAEFWYYGDLGAGGDWTELTSKPIAVNGEAVKFTFAFGETFKLSPAAHKEGDLGKLIGHDWLDDEYYKIFSESAGSGDENIVVKHAGDYLVSLKTVGNDLKIHIVADSPSSDWVYTLDMYGIAFSGENHKAHFFHTESDDYIIGTNYPGVDLTKIGDSHVWKAERWTDLDTVVFSDGTDGNKTNDQTIQAGKCFVIDNTTGERWAGDWISLEAAEFIDSYMKFAGEGKIDPSEQGETAACAENYAAAKAAYNALSSDAVRKDAIYFGAVKDRLTAWARANGDVIDENGGQIQANARISSNPFTPNLLNDNVMPIVIVVVVSVLAVTAIGYLIIRSRKEN